VTLQAFAEGRCVGAVVCKLDTHRGTRRGYLAMLVVDTPFRKFRIGVHREALPPLRLLRAAAATQRRVLPLTVARDRHGAGGARAARNVRRRR
jgi:hypothetical protein